jgi:hypothetical protein
LGKAIWRGKQCSILANSMKDAMSTEENLHRRFVLFVDLPAEISEDEAAEIVGGVDSDLADAYPERSEGDSYFHSLKVTSAVIGDSTSIQPQTRRYGVHLDLFEGADETPDFLDTVVGEANESLRKSLPAGKASAAGGFSIADRASALVHDPSCFYCGERQELDD